MLDLTLSLFSACWLVLAAMAPYLLLGFLVAGILSVVVSPEWVERHLGGSRLSQVVKASFFGVPLPLCSCGVIPVAASLRRHGAGKAATTAFLLSTPQTGVDSVAVTYALLGPFMAVFRPLAALLTGFLGGALVHFLDRDQSGGDVASAGPECTDSCCSDDRDENRLVRALRYGLVTLPRDIGKALLVGIGISGVIATAIEPNTLAAVGTGIVPMLAAMVVGIPLYVCATASTPIALALINVGLSPGAALVFLITGPATNSAAVTTMFKVLGRRTLIIYLITVATGALACGLAIDGLIASGTVAESDLVAPTMHPVTGLSEHQHGQVPQRLWTWIERLSAVALLVLLAHAQWSRPQKVLGEPCGEPAPDAMTIRLKITGMSCQGCVANLTRALNECSGVTAVAIDLGSGDGEIAGQDLELAQLQEAVESLGFSCEPKPEPTVPKTTREGRGGHGASAMECGWKPPSDG